MAEKTTREKLRVLLPHWLDHNQGHAAEFSRWAAAAKKEGLAELAALMEQAVATMKETDVLLSTALEKIGGPAKHRHHHHHDE